jgi:GNAT superfamily N-acetyltransferase
MAPTEPTLRVATPDDAQAIEALMKESVAATFPQFYDERQVESSIRHIATVDALLLEDGTYVVLETDGELVACGGWSRRELLYTGGGSAGTSRLLDPATEPARVRAMFVRSDWMRRGLGRRIIEASESAAGREGFTKLVLGATLPGVPAYLAYGFASVGQGEITLRDGVRIAYVPMEKSIAVSGSTARARHAR